MIKNKIYYISIIFLIVSCNSKKSCKEFDYNLLGIDTNSYKKEKLFFNGKDTIIFKMTDFEVEEMKYSEQSFTHIKKCENGFFADYECKEMNTTLYMYFLRKENGYYYNLFSPQFNQINDKNFDRLEDINFELIKNKNFKDSSLIFKIFVFRGEIFSFIDNNNDEWKFIGYK